MKLLVRIVESLLRLKKKDADALPDMYLPEYLLAIALVCILGGIAAVVGFVVLAELWMLCAAPIAVALGIAAFLCWKNQKIRMLSNDKFEYTTWLGHSYEYYFRDITDLRVNQDSMTLFVGQKKIHIESMAVLSERLANRINQSLEENRRGRS
ncbi:MAG: hypothetical protein II272_00955 [Oscillospiraceae bacterium]|nr:hypothetical protein [Oscillospiraceae bacterium]